MWYNETFNSTLDGTDCIDIDECSTDRHSCNGTSGSECVNEEGFFRCICPIGYRPADVHNATGVDFSQARHYILSLLFFTKFVIYLVVIIWLKTFSLSDFLENI